MLPQKSRIPVGGQTLQDGQAPFARMRDAFARASAHGVSHRRYKIAGFEIDVRIVGEELAEQVTGALSHVETDRCSSPALHIELWDETESGVSGPERPAWHAAETIVLMQASANGRYVCEQRPQGVAMLDRFAHRLIACTRRAGDRYLDERARPFHKLLSTWLNDRGMQFVHAGLVAEAGSGILFGGQGGAGKSTSSIACLRDGLCYLGDDFVGLERQEDGTFSGYGLYASCLLELQHLNRFPELQPHALAPYRAGENKAVVYLGGPYRGALRHVATIRAIALPRIVDRPGTSTEPVSKPEALLALAPTSVMLLPAPTADAFRVLASLVDNVPAYRLFLGPDVSQIPEAVRRLAGELEN